MKVEEFIENLGKKANRCAVYNSHKQRSPTDSRKLSEKRVFPAIDIVKSGTRREDLLLDPDELEAVEIMRKAYNGMRADEAVENILNMFARTKNNKEYIAMVKKNRII